MTNFELFGKNMVSKFWESVDSILEDNSWKLNLDNQKNILTEWTDVAGETITL